MSRYATLHRATMVNIKRLVLPSSIVILAALDAVLTWYGVRAGYLLEVNPVLKWLASGGGLFAVKTAGAFLIAGWLYMRPPQTWRAKLILSISTIPVVITGMSTIAAFA